MSGFLQVCGRFFRRTLGLFGLKNGNGLLYSCRGTDMCKVGGHGRKNGKGSGVGVAGRDLSVNRLTNGILTRGNTGDYVIEKAVIDRAGETIFSTQSEYFNRTSDPDKYHQDAAFKTPLFRDPDIRDRILKSGKDFGIFSAGKKGKKTVYSFAHLKILDMYYVVVADCGKLLAHVGKLDR